MGVYMMIIAIVDFYYRGNYILYDRFWRESELCKFAGFISTFSSELSVLTLTVITLDRLVCIIFPLHFRRLKLRDASYVMCFVWTLVLAISAVPLTGIDYFGNFYGRSGVCLAFHITSSKPKGWEYSVAVFLVLNFVSFLVIFFSYLRMFFVAKQTRSAVRKIQDKNDSAMARRMTIIVATDFFCWVPIILLGFASLGGAQIPIEVSIHYLLHLIRDFIDAANVLFVCHLVENNVLKGSSLVMFFHENDGDDDDDDDDDDNNDEDSDDDIDDD